MSRRADAAVQRPRIDATRDFRQHTMVCSFCFIVGAVKHARQIRRRYFCSACAADVYGW